MRLVRRTGTEVDLDADEHADSDRYPDECAERPYQFRRAHPLGRRLVLTTADEVTTLPANIRYVSFIRYEQEEGVIRRPPDRSPHGRYRHIVMNTELYIVALVASAPGPSALYGIDPTTSEAIILGSPRVGVLKEIIDPWIQIPTTPYYGEQEVNLTIER